MAQLSDILAAEKQVPAEQSVKHTEPSFARLKASKHDALQTKKEGKVFSEKREVIKEKFLRTESVLEKSKTSIEQYSQEVKKGEKKTKHLHKKKLKTALDEYFGRRNKLFQQQKKPHSELTDKIKQLNALLDQQSGPGSAAIRASFLVKTADKLDVAAIKRYFSFDPGSSKRSPELASSCTEKSSEAMDSEDLDSAVQTDAKSDVDLYENLQHILTQDERKTVLEVTKSMPKKGISVDKERDYDPFYPEEEPVEWDMYGCAIYDDAENVTGSLTKKVNSDLF